jgi:hypothetical protein
MLARLRTKDSPNLGFPLGDSGSLVLLCVDDHMGVLSFQGKRFFEMLSGASQVLNFGLLDHFRQEGMVEDEIVP